MSQRAKLQTKKLLSILGVSSLLAATLFTGSASVAATLPGGDRVYLLPCDNTEFNGFLYEVDTVTGEASRVGDWVKPSLTDLDGFDNSVYSCAGPASYNPANGLGYWISWGFQSGFLASVNLETGVNTLVGQFKIAGNTAPFPPISLAIDSDGNAWVTDYQQTPNSLWALDLETASMTLVGDTTIAEDKNYGLAWNSVTDTVYGYNTDNKNLYSVNTTTGAFTLLEEDLFPSPRFTPYAIAFDSAGQLWGNDGDIVSAPLSDLDVYEILSVTFPNSSQNRIYTESIIIVPGAPEAPVAPVAPVAAPVAAPAVTLATTGTSTPNYLGFAAGMLTTGALFMWLARGRRREGTPNS